MPIKVKLTKDENGNIKDIVLNPETITIEKEVWESTLRVSMERAAEIEKLKEEIKNLNEKIKKWKKLFNKIDIVYSKGIYLNVKNEFMLLTSNARELNELFNKWEVEND